MITLPSEQGFVLYVLIMLMLFCSVGLYHTWRQRVRHWYLSEERLGTCGDCTCTFIIGRHEKVVRCPRCNRLHSMKRR